MVYRPMILVGEKRKRVVCGDTTCDAAVISSTARAPVADDDIDNGRNRTCVLQKLASFLCAEKIRERAIELSTTMHSEMSVNTNYGPLFVSKTKVWACGFSLSRTPALHVVDGLE